MERRLESEIQKEIVEWLQGQAWVGHVEDSDRSRASRGKRGTPTGKNTGRPDLRGHTTSGRAFYFEVKAKGGKKPSDEQIAFIAGAIRHRCVAGIVYSLDEVKLICRAEGFIKH